MAAHGSRLPGYRRSMRTGSRVVVTGGAGFLGSWLCRRLLADGAEVVCLDSLVTGARDNVAELESRSGFTFVEADVCDPIAVQGPVDFVFHLASVASPVHYLRLPLETLRTGSVGTTHALDVAERTGARFLLASTSEVYGDPLEHPQHESYWGNVNPLGPRSVYDEAKRFGEATTAAYRRSRGVDTTIARIFNTYGPRMALDDGRVVPAFIQQALAGEPLTVAGDGSEHETTVLELAATIRRLVGSASSIHFVPLPENDPQLRRPDITEAMGLLGWRPRTRLEDGLGATVEWVRTRLGTAPDRQPA
jgi:dTDP-glucose 4,6-dehydratase